MLRKLLALLCIAAFASAGAVPAQAPDANSSDRPRLVVVVVVDQMRAGYVQRFASRWRGGLRRLLDRGAWFANAAYPYAATETCLGHATISTGVFPATHGIAGNTWWDRQTSARVACTEDPAARKIGAVATASAAGDSAVRLLAPSLAEQLRSATPRSRAVTMSVKARSAIMLAGHRADAALWLDDSTGALLTSTAYGAGLPAFARQFAAANPIAADFPLVWRLSAPEAGYPRSRSAAGEGPPPGWTASFPHALSASDKAPGPAFVQRWRASPFADVYIGRLAAAAIKAMNLGRGDGLDYLGIGFSATDYIGHSFGPDSLEIEDDMLVLDRTIGALLDNLDRSVGAGRYVLALTADHGVAAIPEQAAAQGLDAGRTDPRDISAAIDKTLASELGPGRYLAQLIAPDLYFAPGLAGKLDSDPRLWRAVQQAALAVPGVARVVRRSSRTPPSDPIDLTRALALDFYPGRSGDVWIGLKPNWIFSARARRGTTHGTEHAYDRRVPIFLFGKGVKPGRYTASATPADIAPTLAALAGVHIAHTDGRILREALAIPASSAAR